MSELPQVVDVEWLERELGEEDLFVGDVRGPNAHARGHIPGSKPLVLGSPPPMSDPDVLAALASEVGLRLRRHGVTGNERLVLYDRGDGVGAMPAAQMAELAGHPRVAVLVGGLSAWEGEVEAGPVQLTPVKTTFEPRLDAVPTRRTSTAASTGTRAIRDRAVSQVRDTSTCRTCSRRRAGRCRATRCARSSAIRRRS
jgi:3-mercaptopyruvate sulfurtransferase SseA